MSSDISVGQVIVYLLYNFTWTNLMQLFVLEELITQKYMDRNPDFSHLIVFHLDLLCHGSGPKDLHLTQLVTAG